MTSEIRIVDSKQEPLDREFTIWVHVKCYFGRKRRVAEIWTTDGWRVVFASGLSELLFDEVKEAVKEWVTNDDELSNLFKEMMGDVYNSVQYVENLVNKIKEVVDGVRVDVDNINVEISLLKEQDRVFRENFDQHLAEFEKYKEEQHKRLDDLSAALMAQMAVLERFRQEFDNAMVDMTPAEVVELLNLVCDCDTDIPVDPTPGPGGDGGDGGDDDDKDKTYTFSAEPDEALFVSGDTTKKEIVITSTVTTKDGATTDVDWSITSHPDWLTAEIQE